MTITRNFKLYLNAGTASAPYINVNQYDEGEEWVFTLYNEDGSTYTPSSGAIIGIKSDGNAIMNAGSVVGGKVVITETEQMTAASGRAIFELLIDNATHGTANFIVNVERRPSDDAEFSDSDLSMLQEAIDAAEVINEVLDAGGDPSEIITENVNNWLDNHPEATTTVQDGAITAPKINNSLWDKILVNEEVSGNPASFDDGADDVPVSSLKVALEPIQTGSGDPSPTNVRPIIASNGKNLLQNTATTQTVNGITFTVNADGTVTANGTATANATLLLVNNTQIVPTDTSVIVSGCPSGGGSSTYRVFVKSDADAGYVYDTGSGVTVNGVYRISITVYSGTTVNNLVFKPMIRPASITDSTYQPYQGIMVERTGKNLAELKTLGAINLNTGELQTASTSSYARTDIIGCKPNTQYVISAGFQMIQAIVGYYNGSGYITYQVINAGTGATSLSFTTNENATKMVVIVRRSGDTNTLSDFPSVMVEEGTTASDYEPYVGTSYPYTLGQNVYGGTVDLATGVLTVTHGFYTFTGSENPYIQQTGRVAIKAFQGSAKAGSSAPAVCSHFVAVAGGEYAYITTAMTDTELKTYMANNTVTIAYNLETPQTINLTPTQVKTLLGYNNIFSSGTVDVIYYADTKLYIDKRIAELG